MTTPKPDGGLKFDESKVSASLQAVDFLAAYYSSKPPPEHPLALAHTAVFALEAGGFTIDGHGR